MTEEERQQAIERHCAILRENRTLAQEALSNIDKGWTFHEAQGNEPLRDVTEKRAAHYRRKIAQCDDLLAAYERWNA